MTVGRYAIAPAALASSRARPVSRALLLSTVAGGALAVAPAVLAGTTVPARFPAAGELTRAAAVRVAPAPSARVVPRLRRFRPDHSSRSCSHSARVAGSERSAVVPAQLAGATERGARLGARQRGGGPPCAEPDRRPARRAARSRSGGSRTGASSAHRGGGREARGPATPLGRDFYVQSAFVPTDPFFGSFALETSASSRLTDWPTTASSASTARTGQSSSGRRCRTAASGSRTWSRAVSRGWRRSARRSTSCADR